MSRHPFPAAGLALPERTRVVDAVSMKVYSLLTDDPNPIHWDPAAVVAQGLGDRPVNQGGLNAGYAVHALTDWAGGPQTLRTSAVRFRGSVLAGDTVVSGGEITDVQRRDGGIEVTAAIWVRTPDGTDVVIGTATVMLCGTADGRGTTA